MLFSEHSFISFKMSQLPKVCEMLTYSKANSVSVTVTLAVCCLLKGLKLERRGKIDVPDCNVEQKALSSSTSYIKLVIWRQNRFASLQKL